MTEKELGYNPFVRWGGKLKCSSARLLFFDAQRSASRAFEFLAVLLSRGCKWLFFCAPLVVLFARL